MRQVKDRVPITAAAKPVDVKRQHLAQGLVVAENQFGGRFHATLS